MKNHKKLWTGLAALIVLVAGIAYSKSALAASLPPAKVTSGQSTFTATWVDRSNIHIDVSTKSGGTTKTSTATLTDSKWDSNWDYTGNLSATLPGGSSGSTCGTVKLEMNGFGSAIVGMTSRGQAGEPINWSNQDSYGQLKVTSDFCGTLLNKPISIGQWQNAGISFKATASDTINIIDSSQNLTFTSPRLQSDGSVRYYLNGQWGDQCDEVIAVYFNKSGTPMRYFEQTTQGGLPKSSISSSCYVKYVFSSPPRHGSNDNATISDYDFPLENVGALQKPASTQNGNGSATPTTTNSSSASCESNFDSPFGWIICPAFGLADGAVQSFTGFLDDQLCFNTGTTSSTGGVTCPGSADNLSDPVHNAWNIFKNIASALLVIVMLIAVIAQAVGSDSGPLSTYAVRKLLPKLVAAVIIMQISWFLMKWTIDLTNDLGESIGNLMMAPFGGSGHLALEHLMNVSLQSHGVVVNNLTTGAFFVVLAGVGALALSIPGLALMALYVVLAVLTAFIVLLIRKMLIVLLVILAPVALILWILPGTERYWKMWQENFVKLMMMFPMIMALIAAGKIFASITAGVAIMQLPHLAVAHIGFLPVPYFASVSAFVDLGIILGAYFAPYFLLPQTYKWGGTAMGAIAKGVSQGMEKAGKPAVDYLKWRQGLSPWNQARALRKAEVERKAHHDFYEGLTSGGLAGSVRRARLGGLDMPGQGKELRGRIVQQAESELEKSRREEIQRATLQLMQRDLAGYDGKTQDEMRKAIIRGETITVTRPDGTSVQFNGQEYADTHQYGKRAALDRAVVHGHWREIEEYVQQTAASGNSGEIAEMNDFIQQNAPGIGDQMTHLLKGMGIAAASRPENIVKMRQEEIESILGSLSSKAAAGDTEAAQQLSVFVQNYATAASDTRLRTQLDQGGAKAMKAFVDNSSVLNDINYDPAHAGKDGRDKYGLPLIEGGAALGLAVDPATGAAMREIHANIQDTGVIT